jgi:hypothetical protein
MVVNCNDAKVIFLLYQRYEITQTNKRKDHFMKLEHKNNFKKVLCFKLVAVSNEENGL